MSKRKPSNTQQFDIGTALKPPGLGRSAPQSLRVRDCGDCDWAPLTSRQGNQECKTVNECPGVGLIPAAR